MDRRASPAEAADGLAIRELFDAYAHCADRRDAEDQKALFTADMIASLRFLDTFAKIDGSWYFAERKLLLDWSETQPSTPAT